MNGRRVCWLGLVIWQEIAADIGCSNFFPVNAEAEDNAIQTGHDNV